MKRGGPLRRRTPLRSGDKPLKRSPMPRRRASLDPKPNGEPRRRSSPVRKPSGPTPATREAVRLRDGSCRAWALGFALDVRCSGGPHIHHVVLRSQGGGHDADNLLLLCDGHHRLAHDHRRAEAERCGVIQRKDIR